MKICSSSLLLALSLVVDTKALSDASSSSVNNTMNWKCSVWQISLSIIRVTETAMGMASTGTLEDFEKSLLRIDEHVKPQFLRPTKTTANTKEMIYRHLLYSFMSYCNGATPAQKFSNVRLGASKRPLLVGSFNITSHYDKNDLSHYVAVNDHQQSIILAFRGSTYLTNYRDAADIICVRPNSEFFGETPNDAKVFEGYQRVAISQLIEAGNALEQTYRTHPNYTVILVGK